MEPRDETIRDEPLYMTEVQTPSEGNFDPNDPFDYLRNASRYLKDLPRIQLDGLPEDDRECGICHEAYEEHEMTGTIIQIPGCGHRFAFACIYQWLSPSNRPNRNTCPMCREVLFELDRSGWSDDEEMEEEGGNLEHLVPELMEAGFGALERPDPEVMYDLQFLLAQETFTSFELTLDRTARVMRELDMLPRGLLFGKQVHAIFQKFKELEIFSPDQLERHDLTADFVRNLIQKMAALMGQLYAKFRPMLRHQNGPIPWREQGPQLNLLYDQDLHGLLDIGLAHIMGYERLHVDHFREHHPEYAQGIDEEDVH